MSGLSRRRWWGARATPAKPTPAAVLEPTTQPMAVVVELETVAVPEPPMAEPIIAEPKPARSRRRKEPRHDH